MATLNDAMELLVRIDERQEHMRQQLVDVNMTLKGADGQGGLCKRVADLEQTVAVGSASRAGWSRGAKIGIVGGAALAGAGVDHLVRLLANALGG